MSASTALTNATSVKGCSGGGGGGGGSPKVVIGGLFPKCQIIISNECAGDVIIDKNLQQPFTA